MSNRATKRQPNNDRYHSFLESLKGKTVKVYRGGPESKQGVLLDVQSDFVTVYAQNNNNNDNNDSNNSDDNNKNNNQSKNQSNDNNQNNDNNNQNNVVVYYHTKHVKSISEDSKSNSSQVLQSEDTEIEFIQATEFTEVVKQFKDKYIQINQGGPESKNGLVLDVVDDYIILYTEDDGIVYFNVDHVKSIYEYNQNNQNNQENQENQQGNAVATASQVVIPKYETAGNFQDIFGHMSHKWVAINRGGPEAMEGVLVESVGGHYTLVSNEEVLRINPYHIRSISSGSKGSASQNQNNNQDQDQNQNQNQNNAQNQNTNTETTSGDAKNSNSKDNEASAGKSSRRKSRETVVKTIDYRWKPKY